MAAQENHDSVVKLLLANGANQSLATEDGFTPLLVAMQQGHDKVVAVLLESDTRGKVRLPALHIAAKKDDVRAATLLLEVNSWFGYIFLWINSIRCKTVQKQILTNVHFRMIIILMSLPSPASHHCTSHHITVRIGIRIAIIQRHISWNLLSILFVTLQGMKRLPIYLFKKVLTSISLLSTILRHYMWVANGAKQIWWLYCWRKEQISKAKPEMDSLRCTAPVEVATNKLLICFWNAAHRSVQRQRMDWRHCIWQPKGYDVTFLMITMCFHIPGELISHQLCTFSSQEHVDAARILLYHRAPVDEVTVDYLTALHVASHCGHVRVAKLLLDRNADANARALNGFTPLHIACKKVSCLFSSFFLSVHTEVDSTMS